MTVKELREKLADLSDDMPVIVRGGEFDYTDALVVTVLTLDWVDSPDEPDEKYEPYPRRCLAIEP